jgi:hypothetical protein
VLVRITAAGALLLSRVLLQARAGDSRAENRDDPESVLHLHPLAL